MSQKDNQHFVQRAFLNGFTVKETPSELWEYDKENKSISDRIKSTREICSLYQYYAAPGDDGEIDPEAVENALQVSEDAFIRVLRTINPQKNGEKIGLTNEQAEILAFYIGMQFARVPMFRDKIQGFMDNVLGSITEAIVNDQIAKGKIPEELKDYFENGGKIKAESEDWATIDPMIDAAETMMGSLLQKQWLFVVPHIDIPFIVSDNPVKSGHLPGNDKKTVFGPGGPAGYNSIVFMPLRRDLAVLIAPPENFGTKSEELEQNNFIVSFIDKGRSKDMNKETAKNAMRYVYNGKKDHALGRMVFKFEVRHP